MQTQFPTEFDQFLMEAPRPTPRAQPRELAQGELFARLMLRGLPVMKDEEKIVTLH